MKLYQVSFNNINISKHLADSTYHAIELCKTKSNMIDPLIWAGEWKAKEIKI